MSKRNRGYVAFLDLLGFTRRIRNEDFPKSFIKYSDIIRTSLRPEKLPIQYIIFSDSLVINTVRDDLDQLILLSKALSELQYRLLLELDSPLCGTISVGEFSRIEEEGNVLLVGSPFVEAYEYEQYQDWVGIILHPSVVKHNKKIRDLTFLSNDRTPNENEERLNMGGNIQRYQYIPFDDGPFDGFVIVPHTRMAYRPKEIVHDLEKFSVQLDYLKMTSPNPYTQRKYNNTERLIFHLISTYRKIQTRDI